MFFFLNLFIGVYYIIYTVLLCDLPPLRPHCGEAPGRDSNPSRAAQRQGHYTPGPPRLLLGGMVSIAAAATTQ